MDHKDFRVEAAVKIREAIASVEADNG